MAFGITSQVKIPNLSAQPPSPINMPIPGQNFSSLGQPYPKLAKLAFGVTSQAKIPDFLAQPPSPMNIPIPGQNFSSLGLP